MHKIAPQITRQRYLIEGYYNLKVNEDTIEDYFDELIEALKLQKQGLNTLFSPQKKNQGSLAYRSLVDSGITLSIWSAESFLSVTILAHRSFDEKKAIAVTEKFFQMKDHIAKDF